MMLSLELKHGRLALDSDSAKKLAKFIYNAGEIEIRLAGRLIILDDSAPLILPTTRKKPRRSK